MISCFLLVPALVLALVPGLVSLLVALLVFSPNSSRAEWGSHFLLETVFVPS